MRSQPPHREQGEERHSTAPIPQPRLRPDGALREQRTKQKFGSEVFVAEQWGKSVGVSAGRIGGRALGCSATRAAAPLPEQALLRAEIWCL